MKGSIRKRGKTYTAIWWTTDPSTQKRRQESRGGFRTKGGAQEYLNELLASVQAGTWSRETKITIREFIEQKWLPSLDTAVAGGSLKRTTAANYRNVSYRYIIPNIGSVYLPALTVARLNAMYTELLTRGRKADGLGLSPTTVKQIHVSIHRMLRDAVKWGDLQRNVSDYVNAPRAAKPKMTPWSPAQTREFIEQTADDRLGPIWRLFALTGLRRGEVMGLQWSDLELELGRLTVARTRSMAAGRIVVSTPKTASSSRTIGLDSETVSALRTYKARQGRERLAAGEAWANSDGYVIADEVGRPIHPTAISKFFQEARSATGMPKVRLHDLRHGYATAALEAGASMKVVSDRLGHSSIMVTADTYSHVRPEVDQALADQVASLIMAPGTALTNG